MWATAPLGQATDMTQQMIFNILFFFVDTMKLPKICLGKKPDISPVRMDFHRVLVMHLFHNIETAYSFQTAVTAAFFIIKRLRNSCSEEFTAIRYLCGRIRTTNPDIKWRRQWSIEVLSGYSIHLIFNIFNIISSTDCSINSLVVSKISQCEHREIYCGHLPSWRELCPSNKVKLQLVLNCPKFITKFSIFYFMAYKQQISLWINSHILHRNIYSLVEWIIHDLHEVPQAIVIYLYANRDEIIMFNRSHFECIKNGPNPGKVSMWW